MRSSRLATIAALAAASVANAHTPTQAPATTEERKPSRDTSRALRESKRRSKPYATKIGNSKVDGARRDRAEQKRAKRKARNRAMRSS
jgi:hypothetical protein